MIRLIVVIIHLTGGDNKPSSRHRRRRAGVLGALCWNQPSNFCCTCSRLLEGRHPPTHPACTPWIMADQRHGTLLWVYAPLITGWLWCTVCCSRLGRCFVLHCAQTNICYIYLGTQTPIISVTWWAVLINSWEASKENFSKEMIKPLRKYKLCTYWLYFSEYGENRNSICYRLHVYYIQLYSPIAQVVRKKTKQQ